MAADDSGDESEEDAVVDGSAAHQEAASPEQLAFHQELLLKSVFGIIEQNQEVWFQLFFISWANIADKSKRMECSLERSCVLLGRSNSKQKTTLTFSMWKMLRCNSQDYFNLQLKAERALQNARDAEAELQSSRKLFQEKELEYDRNIEQLQHEIDRYKNARDAEAELQSSRKLFQEKELEYHRNIEQLRQEIDRHVKSNRQSNENCEQNEATSEFFNHQSIEASASASPDQRIDRELRANDMKTLQLENIKLKEEIHKLATQVESLNQAIAQLEYDARLGEALEEAASPTGIKRSLSEQVQRLAADLKDSATCESVLLQEAQKLQVENARLSQLKADSDSVLDVHAKAGPEGFDYQSSELENGKQASRERSLVQRELILAQQKMHDGMAQENERLQRVADQHFHSSEELQQKNDRLAQELVQMTERCESLSSRLGEWQDKGDGEVSADVSQIHRTIEELRQENDVLGRKLLQESERSTILDRQLADTQEELEKIRASGAGTNQASEELLQQEVQCLQGQLEESATCRASLLQETQRLEAENENARCLQEHGAAMRTQMECDELKHENDRLQKLSEKLSLENQQCRMSRNSMEQEMNTLLHEIAEKERSEALNRGTRHERGNATDQTSATKEMHHEMQSLESKLKELDMYGMTLQEEEERMELLLEEAREGRNAESKLVRLQEENTSLLASSAEVAEMSKLNEELRDDLQRIEEKLQDSVICRNTLSCELQNLEAEHARSTELRGEGQVSRIVLENMQSEKACQQDAATLGNRRLETVVGKFWRQYLETKLQESAMVGMTLLQETQSLQEENERTQELLQEEEGRAWQAREAGVRTEEVAEHTRELTQSSDEVRPDHRRLQLVVEKLRRNDLETKLQESAIYGLKLLEETQSLQEENQRKDELLEGGGQALRAQEVAGGTENFAEQAKANEELRMKILMLEGQLVESELPAIEVHQLRDEVGCLEETLKESAEAGKMLLQEKQWLEEENRRLTPTEINFSSSPKAYKTRSARESPAGTTFGFGRTDSPSEPSLGSQSSSSSQEESCTRKPSSRRRHGVRYETSHQDEITKALEETIRANELLKIENDSLYDKIGQLEGALQERNEEERRQSIAGDSDGHISISSHEGKHSVEDPRSNATPDVGAIRSETRPSLKRASFKSVVQSGVIQRIRTDRARAEMDEKVVRNEKLEAEVEILKENCASLEILEEEVEQLASGQELYEMEYLQMEGLVGEAQMQLEMNQRETGELHNHVAELRQQLEDEQMMHLSPTSPDRQGNLYMEDEGGSNAPPSPASIGVSHQDESKDSEIYELKEIVKALKSKYQTQEDKLRKIVADKNDEIEQMEQPLVLKMQAMQEEIGEQRNQLDESAQQHAELLNQYTEALHAKEHLQKLGEDLRATERLAMSGKAELEAELHTERQALEAVVTRLESPKSRSSTPRNEVSPKVHGRIASAFPMFAPPEVVIEKVAVAVQCSEVRDALGSTLHEREAELANWWGTVTSRLLLYQKLALQDNKTIQQEDQLHDVLRSELSTAEVEKKALVERMKAHEQFSTLEADAQQNELMTLQREVVGAQAEWKTKAESFEEEMSCMERELLSELVKARQAVSSEERLHDALRAEVKMSDMENKALVDRVKAQEHFSAAEDAAQQKQVHALQHEVATIQAERRLMAKSLEQEMSCMEQELLKELASAGAELAAARQPTSTVDRDSSILARALLSAQEVLSGAAADGRLLEALKKPTSPYDGNFDAQILLSAAAEVDATLQAAEAPATAQCISAINGLRTELQETLEREQKLKSDLDEVRYEANTLFAAAASDGQMLAALRSAEPPATSSSTVDELRAELQEARNVELQLRVDLEERLRDPFLQRECRELRAKAAAGTNATAEVAGWREEVRRVHSERSEIDARIVVELENLRQEHAEEMQRVKGDRSETDAGLRMECKSLKHAHAQELLKRDRCTAAMLQECTYLRTEANCAAAKLVGQQDEARGNSRTQQEQNDDQHAKLTKARAEIESLTQELGRSRKYEAEIKAQSEHLAKNSTSFEHQLELQNTRTELEGLRQRHISITSELERFRDEAYKNELAEKRKFRLLQEEQLQLQDEGSEALFKERESSRQKIRELLRECSQIRGEATDAMLAEKDTQERLQAELQTLQKSAIDETQELTHILETNQKTYDEHLKRRDKVHTQQLDAASEAIGQKQMVFLQEIGTLRAELSAGRDAEMVEHDASIKWREETMYLHDESTAQAHEFQVQLEAYRKQHSSLRQECVNLVTEAASNRDALKRTSEFSAELKVANTRLNCIKNRQLHQIRAVDEELHQRANLFLMLNIFSNWRIALSSRDCVDGEWGSLLDEANESLLQEFPGENPLLQDVVDINDVVPRSLDVNSLVQDACDVNEESLVASRSMLMQEVLDAREEQGVLLLMLEEARKQADDVMSELWSCTEGGLEKHKTLQADAARSREKNRQLLEENERLKRQLDAAVAHALDPSRHLQDATTIRALKHQCDELQEQVLTQEMNARRLELHASRSQEEAQSQSNRLARSCEGLREEAEEAAAAERCARGIAAAASELLRRDNDLRKSKLLRDEFERAMSAEFEARRSADIADMLKQIIREMNCDE